MRTRRIILWVVSIGFGVVSTIGTVLIFGSSFNRFWTNVHAGIGFRGDLPLLLFAGFFSLAFIWGDWLLRTKYLNP